jgi:Tfp pilus assembly protein FimT
MMTVGIFSIVVMIGFPAAWDFYLSYQIETERDNLVTLIREARNMSVVNRNEMSHGLYFDGSSFVVFEGANYANRIQTEDRIVSRQTNVAISGPSEIVFAPLSGETSTSTYILTSNAKIRNVYVKSEGTVDW